VDREVSGLRWKHDRDVCEARVGQQLKWAKADDRTGERKGGWHYGSTVTRIYRGVTWMVELDAPLDHGAGGWANPILAGDRAEVLDQAEP
jgi:hypothetical protein